MVFKRLQDSQDGLYLQAMQLYQSSFRCTNRGSRMPSAPF